MRAAGSGHPSTVTRGRSWPGHAAQLALSFLVGTLAATAQERAPNRLVVEKRGDSPWPAGVGSVEIWPSAATAAGKFTVTTSDGKPVQAQTVWSAVGEPALIRFNTSSGATKYFFDYQTNAVSTGGGWTPDAGVLVETRTCSEGQVNTREQVNRVVASAAPVQGRGLTPNIFLGMNPFGPSADYVVLFGGWFDAPQAGEYGFATVSTDASYLEVDGRLVAEWLGRHDPHGGRRGEHSGKVTLKPGRHRIDYVQVQFRGEPAAEAAWKRPGDDHYELMPASAFPGVARFTVTRHETTAQGSRQLYCLWRNDDHTRLGDPLIVRTRLRVVDAGEGREYRWKFEDGGQATGAAVQHFFLEPGLRQVTLTAWQGSTCVTTNIVRVRVGPNWLQREDWRDDIFNEAREEILHRDLAAMPLRDLEIAIEWGVRLEEQGFLLPLGEAALKRTEEFDAAGRDVVFLQLGSYLQHAGARGDQLAAQALRAAAGSQRLSPSAKEKARLRLADLMLHEVGDLDDAAKWLGTISGNGLTVEERRLWKLLDADLLLARGKVDQARALYSAIGDLGSAKAAPKSTFDHGARLEGASILVQCARFEDAQHALDVLVTERPLERMALDTGLLRMQLSLKRREFRRGFAAAAALLRVAEGDPRKSAVLHGLVEAGLASGRVAEARQALGQLLKEFPYSEAAAQAKEQWGGRDWEKGR